MRTTLRTFAFAAALLPGLAAANGEGSLDTGYGGVEFGQPRVAFNVGDDLSDNLLAMRVLQDGRLELVAQVRNAAATFDVGVALRTPAGLPDTSIAPAGKYHLPLSVGFGTGAAAAIAADGSFYAVGTGGDQLLRVELARRLPEKRIDSVRLDSGDLDRLAREVRQIFDDAGLSEIRIFASGGLDEHGIAALVASGAPIDGYGVGTSLDVSEDHPALDCVYKLQEYDGRPRRKRSTGKATWPGRKQVYRHYDAGGRFDHDVLALEDEPQDGEPLLAPAMRGGKPLGAPPDAGAIRERVRLALAKLPPRLKALDRRAEYRVEISNGVAALARRVDEAFR